MQNSQQSAEADPQSELEFFDWIQIVWSKRYFVLACTVIALLLGMLYLRFANYQYTAKLDVTPVENAGGSGLASQLGSLGGLASLAGISLPTAQGSGSFDLYVESMKSRAVADELAQQPDLMHFIFAREWDEQTKSWHPPKGVLSAIKRGLLSLLGAKGFAWKPPDGARLQEYLDTKLIVAQSAKKRVVNIMFTHRDPQFAAKFLSILHSSVDNRVRQRTLLRANESIAYLERKLPTLTNIEHQRVIAQALSEQEKVRMMASTTAAFAAEPFGEPKASFMPTEPKPMNVLVLSLFGGAMLGSGIALLGALSKSKRRP